MRNQLRIFSIHIRKNASDFMPGCSIKIVIFYSPALQAWLASYSDGQYRKSSHQISNRHITAPAPTTGIGMYCDDPNISTKAVTTTPPTIDTRDITIITRGSKKISRPLCSRILTFALRLHCLTTRWYCCKKCHGFPVFKLSGNVPYMQPSMDIHGEQAYQPVT